MKQLKARDANTLIEIMNAALEKQASQSTSSVNVKHSGDAIVLPARPENMGIPEAIEHLQRIDELENTEVSLHEEVRAFPLDGAVALMKAMQRKFGWATPKPTPGFFGDRPPQTVNVDVSLTESISVLWGEFEIPGVEGTLKCGSHTTDDGEFVFCVGGNVLQKHVPIVRELVTLAREIVKTESIYKGKALRVRVDADGRMTQSPPAFIDISKRDPLILPPLVEAAVNANVFTPIERTDACRQAGIPIRRGIILAGRPGTGKTLTSLAVAAKAVASGWTYILLPDTRSLAAAIAFANRYAPAIVFCEDIDCGPATGPRNAKLNDLLNTIDGVQSKATEVMLVFTTNDQTKIDRTLVRPGRIDAIVEFPAPQDRGTIERFLRHYASGTIAKDEDLTRSCEALQGAIPAILREAVEKAKLFSLSRGVDPAAIALTDEDIFNAVATMRNHIEFFNSKKEHVVSPEEALGLAMKSLLPAADPRLSKFLDYIEEGRNKKF